MDAPGSTPVPPVITRVGIPSVCESTAVNIRAARTSGHRLRTQKVKRALQVGVDLEPMLGRERPSRRTARSAVSLDEIHAVLDRLDELGAGVPTERRDEMFVKAARSGQLAGPR
jgi:hypothetical protein